MFFLWIFLDFQEGIEIGRTSTHFDRLAARIAAVILSGFSELFSQFWVFSVEEGSWTARRFLQLWIAHYEMGGCYIPRF